MKQTIKESLILFMHQKHFWSHLCFGFKIAKLNAKKTCFSMYEQQWQHALEEFFHKKLEKQIEKYNNIPFSEPTKLNNGKIPIWRCWLQGFENSPDLIKICGKSAEKMTPTHTQIIQISYANLNQYVSLPKHVIKKHKKGIIRAAHFSDIIRHTLLATYGGIWLDATLYMSKPLYEKDVFSDYFCIKSQYDKDGKSGALYCTCIGSYKINPLFSFVRDALSWYWKKYNRAITYDFMSTIMHIAYECISSVKNSVDKLEPNIDCIDAEAANRYCSYYNTMNLRYDKESVNAIKNQTTFHKFTYKNKLIAKTEDGDFTVYGKLLEEYGFQVKDYTPF